MTPYPAIDPIALQIGPLAIRWYSLAYLAGILLGWWLILSLHRRRPIGGMTKQALDDMILWAVAGIVIGGRLGYVIFYKPSYYLSHPVEIFYLWQGGMSFHGGMLGTILAFWWFSRTYRARFLEVMDAVACVAPLGIFFGRIANFINGELFGRVTDPRFGMVFPHGGDQPRHPSQLYEAALEGLLLFAVLYGLARFTRAREKVGLISGLFLVGYGMARMFCEQFREPDDYIGFLAAGLTMGQWLCVPMLVVGSMIALKAWTARKS